MFVVTLQLCRPMAWAYITEAYSVFSSASYCAALPAYFYMHYGLNIAIPGHVERSKDVDVELMQMRRQTDWTMLRGKDYDLDQIDDDKAHIPRQRVGRADKSPRPHAQQCVAGDECRMHGHQSSTCDWNKEADEQYGMCCVEERVVGWLPVQTVHGASL